MGSSVVFPIVVDTNLKLRVAVFVVNVDLMDCVVLSYFFDRDI